MNFKNTLTGFKGPFAAPVTPEQQPPWALAMSRKRNRELTAENTRLQLECRRLREEVARCKHLR